MISASEVLHWFVILNFDTIKKSYPHKTFILYFCSMLSKKDVALLRGMFQEQEGRFDQKLDDLRVDLRDEIHSVVNGAISASEARMMKRMNEIKEEIIDGITEIIDEGILPRISDLQSDMRRVKNHLQMA